VVRAETYEATARRVDSRRRSSGTRVCRGRESFPRLDLESSEYGEEHQDKNTWGKDTGNRTVEVRAATRSLGGSRAGFVSIAATEFALHDSRAYTA